MSTRSAAARPAAPDAAPRCSMWRACAPTFRSSRARSTARPLVYLDSAASSQRPWPVLRAVEHYETSLHANVHRGVHSLSQWATEAYEGARETVRRFLNARSAREIVFVRGTTEAINLVANSWGRGHLQAGDEVLITLSRAPRQHRALADDLSRPPARACARRRCSPTASSIWRRFVKCSDARTRLVAVAHVSNALGTVLPVREIVRLAHARGVPVLLDGAQAVAASARRRAGAGLRLLCFLGPQGLRPDRHRRALWARGAAGGDAALAGRRRHDPVGEHRGHHLQRAAVEIRGRHPQYLRCRRARRRARVRREPRPRARSPRTSTRCSSWRRARLVGAAGSDG